MSKTLKLLFLGSLVISGCAGNVSPNPTPSTPAMPAGDTSTATNPQPAQNGTASMGDSAGTGGTAGNGSMGGTAANSMVINAPAALALGTSGMLTVTLHTVDGDADITGAVVWGSSDSGVVAINGSSHATGMGEGSADIQATYNDMSAKVTITVGPAVVTGLEVTAPMAPMAIFDAGDVSATATYSDGHTADVTDTTTWTTSDARVAFVPTGANQVQASGGGSTTLTGTFGGANATALVTVNGPALVGLAMDPASLSLQSGEIHWIAAYALYEDGSNAFVPYALADLSTADMNVASLLHGDLTGVVQANNGGQTVVTAGYGGLTATVSIDVTDVPGSARPQ
ncbi:MAG: Ig domain protein group 2 domain protein [Myxococcales bacterium]|nr:Ig domain protein group 2 domain protein [Myxococcales bacterium]